MVGRSVATNPERVDPSYITSHAVPRSHPLVHCLSNAFEVANCFQAPQASHTMPIWHLALSKHARPPCFMLEMRSRSGTYNSINSNHASAHVREWLSSPVSSRSTVNFYVASTQNDKYKDYAFTKWKGWNAFHQNSKVSWLKLKLQTVGFF